jgi:hypothetical protein
MSECERDGTGTRTMCYAAPRYPNAAAVVSRGILRFILSPRPELLLYLIDPSWLMAGGMFSISRHGIVVQHVGYTKPRVGQ